MTIRFFRQRRPPPDHTELDAAEERVTGLEERSAKTLPRLITEGARNGFANRWRATIHHRPPTA